MKSGQSLTEFTVTKQVGAWSMMASLRSHVIFVVLLSFCICYASTYRNVNTRQYKPNVRTLARGQRRQTGKRISDATWIYDANNVEGLSPGQILQLENTTVSGLRRPNRRSISNFKVYPGQTAPSARTLANYDPSTLFPSSPTFNVIITHLPPWVSIDGLDSPNDPGNLNQTKVYIPGGGGQLSGFFLDYLNSLGSSLGVNFQYYFPCKTVDIAAGKTCGALKTSDALAMLAGDTSYFLPNCSDSRCFALNIPISPDTVQNFWLTQPIIDEGWTMVVRTGDPAIDFMSWLAPFYWTLWVVTLAEIALAAFIMVLTEGYGANENIWDFNFAAQYFDCFQWSFACLFGAMSQSPATWAGRTIYVCQLFIGQLLLALYTGSLVNFLSIVTLSIPMSTFNDLTSTSSDYYLPSHSICTPTEFPQVYSFVQRQQQLFPNAKFKIANASTLDDCIRKVYLGVYTTTMFQNSVMLTRTQQYYNNGMCGSGGFCTSSGGVMHTELTNANDCTCPPTLKLFDGTCTNPDKNYWTAVDGSLIVTGTPINSEGYGLAFADALPELQHDLWSEAILWSKDTGLLSTLLSNSIPTMDAISQSCAAGASPNVIQLDFINMEGLFTLSMLAVGIGIFIGFWETIVDLSLRFCPCFKTFRNEDDKATKKGKSEEMEEIDEDEVGAPAIDEQIAELQTRVAQLSTVLSGTKD